MINILDHIELSTILNMLNLDMKDKGHYYLGCCPMHEDKSPSFSIRKKDGYFSCWKGCDSGSIKKLIYLLTGQGAFRFLGIKDIDSFYFKNSFTKKEDKDRSSFPVERKVDLKGTLKQVYDNEIVYNFLKSKRVSDYFIDSFSIQYCDYVEINESKLKNRLIIPIEDSGRLVGYEARDFTNSQKPKVLYHKGCDVSGLFNYDNLDLKKEVVLVEGFLKMSQIYTHITENCIHSYGAQITPRQKELLKNIPNLTVFQDNDEAGDNLVSEMDSWMLHEFNVVKSEIRGQDAADMTLDEIKKAFEKKKISVEYFIDKVGLFEDTNIEWKF